jgi:putative ABC transport system permease protein
VFGVSSNWLALRSEEVAEGEFFTPQQDASSARVAVIGADVQKDLFPGEDPLNKTIRIADVPFEIVGVLKSRGAGPAGASLDNLVIVPIGTSARRLFNRDYLTMLIAQVRDADRGDQAAAEISRLLRERHQIRPPALDDFTLTSPAATMEQVNRAGSTLARILIGVAVMALLIGAIVIMSLMSIAVAERRKEIGVRRSVGADRASIIYQFLLEAVLVSFSGGIVGVLIGFGGMQLVARLQRLPLVIVWPSVLSAIVLSLLVGVTAGIYPAWKASRVDPIQALRS